MRPRLLAIKPTRDQDRDFLGILLDQDVDFELEILNDETETFSTSFRSQHSCYYCSLLDLTFHISRLFFYYCLYFLFISLQFTLDQNNSGIFVWIPLLRRKLYISKSNKQKITDRVVEHSSVKKI